MGLQGGGAKDMEQLGCGVAGGQGDPGRLKWLWGCKEVGRREATAPRFRDLVVRLREVQGILSWYAIFLLRFGFSRACRGNKPPPECVLTIGISQLAFSGGWYPATTGANSAAGTERLCPARGRCAKPGSRQAVGLHPREQHQGQRSGIVRAGLRDLSLVAFSDRLGTL